MSFKIIIERNFKEAVSPEILEITDGIRMKALRHRGYIGGETMVNMENERELLVISSWSNLEDWKTWYSSNIWKEQEKQLAPHLAETPVVKVFKPGADLER